MNSKKKNNTKVYLYNTLTRSKTEFVPLNPDNIGIYVCGPTVYDYAHIGNARPVIVFDVLVRLFRHLYGDKKVTYVRNITDVDDKIIDAHQRTGESISELTSRTIRAFQNDMSELGNKAPDIEPRATDHIVEMQEMISLLIRKGNAYEKDGHVLFDVSTNSTYGKLSHRNLDELIAGARVEVAPYKKNPSDFVLWKPSDANQPGWSSPWDQENHPGRPGWHIECSAMSQKYLGDTFDIHAGGVDLVFPHHENEMAQSQCANGLDSFAKIWMHNGFLTIEGEKMSKSIGNIVSVRDLLKENSGETIRLCMLTTHYRQPINWTTKSMKQAKKTLDGWYS